MTYIGFDGKGYQTGLASSHNLADWKKLACILPRDPNSPITRFNIAMNGSFAKTTSGPKAN